MSHLVVVVLVVVVDVVVVEVVVEDDFMHVFGATSPHCIGPQENRLNNPQDP